MSNPLRDNRDTLVAVPATFLISAPKIYVDRPHVNSQGRAVYLPGSGGIALGLHAGMPVTSVLADHAIPGISLEDGPSSAHGLACVGNRVRDGAGSTVGAVAGKRGGLAPGFIPGQFLGVEAPDDVLAHAVPGDTMVIETYGRGLALLDYPEVAVLNCSPRALDALNLSWNDKIEVPVRMGIPGVLAASGLGSDPWIGDLEVGRTSPQLESLRFGDIVAFNDIDGRVSRSFRTGFVSIGIVSHGPSPVAGHGIGITLLLSGPAGELLPRRVEVASLAGELIQWSRENRTEWSVGV